MTVLHQLGPAKLQESNSGLPCPPAAVPFEGHR